MVRTRRRWVALYTTAAIAFCLKPTAIAWSTPIVTIKSREVQVLAGGKLNLEEQQHHMSRYCSALRTPPLLWQLTPTSRRRHRVSIVSQTRVQSGGLQELENLRAAASNGTQPQTKTKITTKSQRRSGGEGTKRKLQSVDFTTALVMSRELAQTVVPSRVENAYQLDPYNLAIGLRTLEGNMWLHVCWHPQVREPGYDKRCAVNHSRCTFCF